MPARRSPRSLPMTTRFAAMALVTAVTAITVADAPPGSEAVTEPSPPQPTGFVNSLGIEMRPIPAGRFTMGSTPTERGHRPNESPAHEVTLTRPYLLAATEITIGQFQAFVDATGYVTDAERDAAGGFGIDWSTGRVVQAEGINFRDPGFPGGFLPGPDHAAVLLTWQDAEAFCRWLSKVEGRSYRLPTEAEWERAARGGTTGRWWFGEDPGGHANIGDRSLAAAVPAMDRGAAFDDGHAFTAPVGSFPPNPYGLHDMHGNVWEWCADLHDETWYLRTPAVDPSGPVDGTFRSIRGGGWLNHFERTRAAQRVYFTPTFRYCLLSGFRIAADAVAEPDAVRTPEARGAHTPR